MGHCSPGARDERAPPGTANTGLLQCRGPHTPGSARWFAAFQLVCNPYLVKREKNSERETRNEPDEVPLLPSVFERSYQLTEYAISVLVSGRLISAYWRL